MNLVGADTSSLMVGIHEGTNGNMTTGLTINQGAADNEILAFKSTDVAHGFTSYGETDTFGAFKKSPHNSAYGGLQIIGITEEHASSTVALEFYALGGVASTAKTGSATGTVFYQMIEHDGSNTATAYAANSNIMAWRCFVSGDYRTRYIWDVEGSAHAEVEWTTYDTFDDLALVRDMETELLLHENEAKTARRHYMEQTGIIGEGSWTMENGKPRAMVNFTKLAMLHHGALIQAGDKFSALESALTERDTKIALLEQRLNRLEN